MKRSLRRKISLAALIVAMLALTTVISSCVPEAFGPNITSATITPSTISESNTGMTDEYFDVTLNTSGFDGEFQDAEVFIQIPGGSDRPANGSFSTIEPDDISTITSDPQSIPLSWFGGLEPGVYNIGATVQTDLEDYTQLDVATVEVTAN
ncbi:MAG: hypothetical protein ACQEVA_04690 [Myxococcota bacterium]